MVVSREFFNLVTYGVFRALAELYGKEGWKVPPAFGEIAFRELKKRIKFKGFKPIEALNKLARYFENVGYIEKIGFEQIGENELICSMEGVSIDWTSLNSRRKVECCLTTKPAFTRLPLKELFDAEPEMIDLEFSVVEGKFCATEKWIETSAKFNNNFLFLLQTNPVITKLAFGGMPH